MPKLKNYNPGRRVNIWLPERHDKIAKDIENLSQFVQIALDQAASIMAFDIVKQQRGIKQEPPTPEQVARWNQDHPQNPLTKKRENKCNTPNSPQNPVLS
ncbi:hypothetical protein KDA23_07935 [Candidatus Saccharibacteria bacterium]|nr:hypothetical protein [Candidatus Saccharibacteria bacterium]